MDKFEGFKATGSQVRDLIKMSQDAAEQVEKLQNDYRNVLNILGLVNTDFVYCAQSENGAAQRLLKRIELLADNISDAPLAALDNF